MSSLKRPSTSSSPGSRMRSPSLELAFPRIPPLAVTRTGLELTPKMDVSIMGGTGVHTQAAVAAALVFPSHIRLLFAGADIGRMQSQGYKSKRWLPKQFKKTIKWFGCRRQDVMGTRRIMLRTRRNPRRRDRPSNGVMVLLGAG
ncbi:hypothetical protein M408DRAFT_11968 [Serendipita vermifera MAFF 305830]|uniref:Uncharacterized protein n=1 Tax=Serendipita vermifera MAFF 305830 TaxID=933852 RepID=A0A0C2W889_SERVB|nr:hypothetical protein M408DRAFT_11968 [Serendipita vermifera MAFF 305830]